MKDKDDLQEIYIRPCKWFREGRTMAQKQTALAVGCTLYLGHEGHSGLLQADKNWHVALSGPSA